jgi:hypothetical protein
MFFVAMASGPLYYDRMRTIYALIFILTLLPCCSRSPSFQSPKAPVETAQKDEQYKKEMEEIRKAIKGELKIKLKRDGKAGAYSWEIAGKDPQEILKANDVFARKLGAE